MTYIHSAIVWILWYLLNEKQKPYQFGKLKKKLSSSTSLYRNCSCQEDGLAVPDAADPCLSSCCSLALEAALLPLFSSPFSWFHAPPTPPVSQSSTSHCPLGPGSPFAVPSACHWALAGTVTRAGSCPLTSISCGRT